MVAGLFIRNDSGTIQIDENFSEAVLRDKQLVTLGAPLSGGFGSRFLLTVSGNNPALAIASAEFCCITNRTNTGGSNWQFTIISSAAAGTNITVFVVDATVSQSSNFGMMVWNASGGLVFASDSRPARIVGMAAGTASYNFGEVPGNVYGVQTFTYGAGRTYGIVCEQPGFANQAVAAATPFPGTFKSQSVVSRSTATGIETGSFYGTNQNGWAGATFSNSEGKSNVLVIDVTNY